MTISRPASGQDNGGDIDILRLDSDKLTKVANFALPGHPARCVEVRPEARLLVCGLSSLTPRAKPP
jgi:hypothetical protein